MKKARFFISLLVLAGLAAVSVWSFMEWQKKQFCRQLISHELYYDDQFDRYYDSERFYLIIDSSHISYGVDHILNGKHQPTLLSVCDYTILKPGVVEIDGLTYQFYLSEHELQITPAYLGHTSFRFEKTSTEN